MNRYVTAIFATITFLATISGSALALAKDVTIDQQNKTFLLDNAKVSTITINRGDTIHFMNKDPWFHNIFSLSDLKTFDLGSYPQGESRPVTFDNEGTVLIECAIHPNMLLEVTVK
ncbi:cupredoxin domain-containing protein [Kaarinaea lacus]